MLFNISWELLVNYFKIKIWKRSPSTEMMGSRSSAIIFVMRAIICSERWSPDLFLCVTTLTTDCWPWPTFCWTPHLQMVVNSCLFFYLAEFFQLFQNFLMAVVSTESRVTWSIQFFLFYWMTIQIFKNHCPSLVTTTQFVRENVCEISGGQKQASHFRFKAVAN